MPLGQTGLCPQPFLKLELIMRIIGFSSAATPSLLWTLPVQALAPWMSRVKHFVRQAAQGDSEARTQARSCISTKARAASNEAVFAGPTRPGNTVRAGCRATPLRVVRESDTALDAECAGRMVISGRMADICAELDRMELRAGANQDACAATRP